MAAGDVPPARPIAVTARFGPSVQPVAGAGRARSDGVVEWWSELMESSWYLFDSGARQPAENMAWDEALLETAPARARPLLRFYAWSEPAATFGYFQKYQEVERMTSLRPLIRRPTGGGLVPHATDWTYSVVIPPTDAWYALSAIES